jgi:uncharacterized protein with HEPN domain
MNSEVKKCLRDVLDAEGAIREFTAGKDFAAYERNRQLRSAIERQFEIIGEALSRLERIDPAVAGRILELRAVIGLRNRIIHGYDSVDDEIVWDIVQSKLPALQKQVEAIMEENSDPLDGRST